MILDTQREPTLKFLDARRIHGKIPDLILHTLSRQTVLGDTVETRGAYIRPEDVQFDNEGRAIIADPQTVARLRGDSGIKNIGCCSVADALSGASARESLTGVAGAAIKNLGCCSLTDSAPGGQESLTASAASPGIKNIGCCSVADALKEATMPESVAASSGIKNIGCCSIADALKDASARESLTASTGIKNIGCCSIADALQETSVRESLTGAAGAAIKNIGCCSLTDAAAAPESLAAGADSLGIKNLGCCSIADSEA